MKKICILCIVVLLLLCNCKKQSENDDAKIYDFEIHQISMDTFREFLINKSPDFIKQNAKRKIVYSKSDTNSQKIKKNVYFAGETQECEEQEGWGLAYDCLPIYFELLEHFKSIQCTQQLLASHGFDEKINQMILFDPECYGVNDIPLTAFVISDKDYHFITVDVLEGTKGYEYNIADTNEYVNMYGNFDDSNDFDFEF